MEEFNALNVKKLTKMYKELDISLTKSDGTRKLKKDLIKSFVISKQSVGKKKKK